MRGMEILRCFKPGMSLLGNSEIAERTGLPPSTISRLTQSLVISGFLEHDPERLAYRLTPTVLCLGHAFKTASAETKIAEPLMRQASEKLKLNVGLAVADRLEMVYLESIRYTKNIFLVLKKQKINNWEKIELEIHKAIESMLKNGYCVANWLPNISAVSTSVQLLNGKYASLNLSTPAESRLNEVIENFTPALFELKNKIEIELSKLKSSMK